VLNIIQKVEKMKHITYEEIPIIEPEKDGYYEIYKHKKVWHKKKNMKFASKEEMDKGEFALLVHDDYELVVEEITTDTQDKYMAKAGKDGKIPTEPIVNVVFGVVGCKDGSDPIDDEGNPAIGRKIFFTGRPDSMGWRKSGEPAITRCFLAYATEQDIDGELELDAWEDLVGKTLYAEIIQYTTQAGKKRNKISHFVLPPKT